MDAAVTDTGQEHASAAAIETALTSGEVYAAITTAPSSSTVPAMIAALARHFEADPADIGRALQAARISAAARRAAAAPPPPVSPYYKLTWAEREVTDHEAILTAAELAHLADAAYEDGDTRPASSDAALMWRITRRAGEYAFSDSVADLDYDTGGGDLNDFERFDFEAVPLTPEEAFDQGHTLWRLNCFSCGARVERRGDRYLHAEQGQFTHERGLPPNADVAVLLAQHAPGQVCPDDQVTEDRSVKPYGIDDMDELAAQWGLHPPAS